MIGITALCDQMNTRSVVGGVSPGFALKVKGGWRMRTATMASPEKKVRAGTRTFLHDPKS